MKLSDAIAMMQELARNMPGDPDLELFDRVTSTVLTADLDDDNWDFEILRGDNCIVIEF